MLLPIPGFVSRFNFTSMTKQARNLWDSLRSTSIRFRPFGLAANSLRFLNSGCILAVLHSIALAQPPALLPPVAPQIEELTSRFPFCVVISEEFANQFASQTVRECGPVRDFIVGAQVVGEQSTQATAQLDFLPSPNTARMSLNLTGTTTNQTINYTPQAVVRSQGDYQFQVLKQIDFDGTVFKTWTPSAFLTINQRNLDAFTPASAILGPLANNIAMREAERRRPIAEQIAAQRVTQQVVPEFNTQADQQLAELNQQLETLVRAKLREFKILPKRTQAATTNNSMLLGFDIRDNPSTLPKLAVQEGRGLAVMIHQSYLQALLALSSLSGLEIPDSAFDDVPGLLRGEVTPELEPKMATLVFDELQPVAVRIREGLLEIELRVAFRPKLGPLIPTQQIMIEVTPVIEDGILRIEQNLGTITALDPAAGDQFLAGVASEAIRQQMSQHLTPHSLPVSHQITAGQGESEKQIQLSLEAINLSAEWMTLQVQAQALQQQGPVLDGWTPIP